MRSRVMKDGLQKRRPDHSAETSLPFTYLVCVFSISLSVITRHSLLDPSPSSCRACDGVAVSPVSPTIPLLPPSFAPLPRNESVKRRGGRPWTEEESIQ